MTEVTDQTQMDASAARRPAAPGRAQDHPERPARGEEKPVIEVSSTATGLSRDTFRELWLYREVLWALTVRLVKVKYKQAVIGIGWAVLQPLLAAGIFAIVFGHLARLPSEGEAYWLFALSGMVAWTFFSQAGNVATQSLVDVQVLLRKVYFPREVVPMSAIGAGLVDFAPALALLLVVSPIFGNLPTLAWLALPLPVLLLVLSATALGLGFSAVNVYYRDVKHVVPFVFQVGLYATPVIYPLSLLPSPWETIYGIANPVAAAIEALRDIVVRGDWPDPLISGGALAWTLVLLVANVVLFKRLERSFADRV